MRFIVYTLLLVVLIAFILRALRNKKCSRCGIDTKGGLTSRHIEGREVNICDNCIDTIRAEEQARNAVDSPVEYH